MVDENGKSTRLALSAHAWGESVPKTMVAAKKLADKGTKLLEQYRATKTAIPKRDEAMPAKAKPAAKKNSLVANINKRKKAGTSRSKKKSTVDDASYKKMKEGWKKK